MQAELEEAATAGPATIRLIDTDRPPQRFGVFREGNLLGVVSAAAHADVAAVIDCGIEFDSRIAEGVLVLGLPTDAAAAT